MNRNCNFIQNRVGGIRTIEKTEAHGLGEQISGEAVIGNEGGILAILRARRKESRRSVTIALSLASGIGSD